MQNCCPNCGHPLMVRLEPPAPIAEVMVSVFDTCAGGYIYITFESNDIATEMMKAAVRYGKAEIEDEWSRIRLVVRPTYNAQEVGAYLRGLIGSQITGGAE